MLATFANHITLQKRCITILEEERNSRYTILVFNLHFLWIYTKQLLMLLSTSLCCMKLLSQDSLVEGKQSQKFAKTLISLWQIMLPFTN